MFDSGVVLEKVCEYLYYNQKHSESKDVSDMDIPPELCLELLIAADYLDGMHAVTQGRVCADKPSLISAQGIIQFNPRQSSSPTRYRKTTLATGAVRRKMTFECTQCIDT